MTPKEKRISFITGEEQMEKIRQHMDDMDTDNRSEAMRNIIDRGFLEPVLSAFLLPLAVKEPTKVESCLREKDLESLTAALNDYGEDICVPEYVDIHDLDSDEFMSLLKVNAGRAEWDDWHTLFSHSDGKEDELIQYLLESIPRR